MNKDVKKDKGEERLEKLACFMCPDAKMGKWYVYFAFAMIAAALVCTGAVIYFIACPMEGYLHADFTDTIYWADASYVSGKVFNPDFKYAALLPFSANLWFIPLIAMFGVSMKTQVIGMIIFALLMVAAIYFMCRSFKWSIPWTMFAIASFLMIMSSSEKLREIMWGHVIYYSLILLLLFFGIGIASRISEMKLSLNVKSFAVCILGVVFFTLVATNGFQIIGMVTLPVAGALFADLIFNKDVKLADKKNIKTYAVCFGALVSTALGSAILTALKGDITANYANAQSHVAPMDTWVDHILMFPEEYFLLMGYKGDVSQPLLEKDTILMLVNLLIAVLILVMPLVLLFNYKRIEDKGTRLILWMHLIVTAVTMFGWICGYLSGANWRLTSMVGTAVIATVASIRFLARQKCNEGYSTTKRLAAILAACCALITVLNFNMIRKMPADYGRDNILHKLTAKLEEEGLEYGYATFWRSQAITLLSDSEVKTRMVLADSNRGVWSDFYQNCYSWYKDQEGVDRYFVLLSDYESRNAMKNDEWENFVLSEEPENIHFEGYVIYIFDKNINIELPE